MRHTATQSHDNQWVGNDQVQSAKVRVQGDHYHFQYCFFARGNWGIQVFQLLTILAASKM
jgi:hypothetical protein